MKSKSTHKGWYTRGYLPHFDAEGALQSISFRLSGSVPDSVIQRWKDELNWSEKSEPDLQKTRELRRKIATYEDSGHGDCFLADQRVADLVQKAFEYFDGEHYRLVAWCVMPNHVHVLIKLKNQHSLPDIIRSWKSFTARRANKLIGQKGRRFWSPGYFDRYIRNRDHLMDEIAYIANNPVRAGLVKTPEQWPWSGYVTDDDG